MQESSVYRSLIAEGMAKGLAEGEAKGRVEGEVEGRLAELRLTLVTLVEQKFGGIPPDLEARVQQTADADKLRAAIRQMLTVAAAADIVL